MAPALRQLCRYAAVGVTNTLVTLAIYAAGLRLGLHYLPDGAAAFAVGGLNGFVLNRRWTFGHRGPAGPAAARYAVVQAAGLLANVLLLRLAVHGLAVPRAAGEVAAVPPVTLLTFALTRTWALPPAPALHAPTPATHAHAARRARVPARRARVGAGAGTGGG